MGKFEFGLSSGIRRIGVALSLAMLLSATAFLAVACGQDSGDGGTTTPNSDAALKIGIPDDVTTTNIWSILGGNSTAYNLAAFLNRYPSLMRYGAQRFDWVPLLAADLPSEVMEEGSGGYSVTAQLREDAFWSDGEAIDANDIVFTAETVLDLQLSGNWATSYNSDFLTRVEAVDDFTVKYYFNETGDDGEVRFPGLGVWQYGVALGVVVPEHYWAPIIDNLIAERGSPSMLEDKVLKEWQNALFAAGNILDEPSGGPAIFVSREPGAFVALASNDGSFLRDSADTLYDGAGYEVQIQGETNVYYGDAEGDTLVEVEREFDLENTIFNVYESQDAAILALQAGEIDYFLSPLGLSPGLLGQVTGREDISTFENPSNGYRYLAFNAVREPFNDRAFREAVATLIDRDFLADSVLQGAVDAIYTPVSADNTYWFNPNVKRVGEGLSREERINRVIKILGDAGYTWETEPSWNADQRRVEDGSGLRGPDGNLLEEFELLAPSAGYDPFRATAAIWIESWLNEAGIPTRANLTGFNEIVERVFRKPERDFDMWILGFGLNPFPNHLESFWSEAQTASGGDNAGGWVNEEYEALLARFLAEPDQAEVQKIAFELQDILTTELPVVTLFSAPIREAYRSGSIQFDYTEELDSIQNTFQWPSGALSFTNSE